MRFCLRKYSGLILAAMLLPLITTCETPLSLGGKINTEVPVIRIPDADGRSQPGSFLAGDGQDGENRIWLEVKQDFGIDYVYMTIEYELLDEFGKPSGIFIKEDVPASLDRNTGLFYVDIDTIKLKMADGQFKAWITAVDISGKKTTSTDIIYVVKNNPPQIELTIPAIRGGTMKNQGYPKDEIPDFDDPNLNKLLVDEVENHVFVGFDLMGLATDNLGIEQGYPKIMIWPRGEALDSNGEPVNARYRVWHSTVLPRTPRTGEPALTATRFTWPMVNLIADSSVQGGYRLPRDNERRSPLSAGFYQFKIWTMDIYGKSNYYPNRTDNERGPNNTRLAPDTHELKHMEVYYKVADIPIINIREIPLYFNGLAPFTVKVDVTTSNQLESVEAYVRYNYLDTGTNTVKEFESPYYDLGAYKDFFENTYNYEFTISEAIAASWPEPADSNTMVYFIATDIVHNVSPTVNREFLFITEPPEVTFVGQLTNTNVKAQGALKGGAYEIYNPIDPPRWVTGRITVSGSSIDKASNIAKVYYHIGKLDDDGFPDHENLSDEARNSIYDNESHWIDTGLDIGAPVSGWSGNVNTWNYTENFNGYREDPLLRNKIQLDTDLGYKTDNFNYGTTMNRGLDSDHSARFYLPFYVKVLSNAGNQTVIHYKLCIDPNLDIPLVNISNPSEGDTVGGEIRLSGTAADNEWVHTILVRIKKDGEAGWYFPGGISEFQDYPSSYITSNPLYDTVDKDGWFKANIIGNNDMVVGWFHNINGDTLLNPAAGEEAVKVTIEVRAIDAKSGSHNSADRVGPAETLVVYFSSEVPTISNPIIKKDGTDRDHTIGIVTSGKFTVTTTIADNEGIDNVRARFDRNAPLVDIIKDGIVQEPLPAGWQITPDNVTFGRDYTLTFEIDSITNSFYPVVGYGNTGYLNMELTVQNIVRPNPFTTTRTYPIGIDNFYPNAEINTHSIASGESFLIEGTARDNRGAPMPELHNMERVLIYFETAEITYSGGTRTVTGTGTYLNPRGRKIGDDDNTGDSDSFYNKTVYTGAGLTWHTEIPPMDSYDNMRDPSLPNSTANGPDGPNVSDSVPFPVLRLISKGDIIGDVWESPHAIVIDNQELGVDVDSDEDGTYGERWSGFSDKDWGARMDTTEFDDGPLMVHYIVMDHAGNATHYKKDIYIENSKPVIQSINLGTDIDGSNNLRYIDFRNHGLQTEDFIVRTTTSGNREISLNEISEDNTPFRIWNDEFSIKLSVESGNGDKNYRLSHVREDGVIDATAMIRGEVYTIVSQGTTEWPKYGAISGNVNTTFVATGAGTGSGTVKQYSVIGGKTKTDKIGSANTINTTFGFSDTEFDDVSDAADQLFIIKIFDSAVTSVGGLTEPPEADQLAHAVLVKVDIENNDLVPPTINTAPFGTEFVLRTTTTGQTRPNSAKNGDWEASGIPALYYDNNIVTDINAINAANPGTRHGYVQYAGHPAGSTADISGKVIFIGKTADNQRIAGIRASIPGYNTSLEIAQWDGTAGVTGNGAVVSASTATVKSIDHMAANDVPWAFEVIHEELTLEYGHVLVWRFAWDSSTISTIVANDVDIQFEVYDARKITPGPNETTTPAQTVDIVPYITEVVTGLSGAYAATPSAFARSALGWYPVRENEPITIRGFNLLNGVVSTAPGTLNPVVRLGGTGSGTDGTQLTPIADGGGFVSSKTQIRVNVGSTAVSGPLVVRVGSVNSINNHTSETAPYNSEANNVNNNTLDNRRSLYVWNTGYLYNAGVLDSPFMRMSSNGARYMTYGYYVAPASATSGRIAVRNNNNETIVEQSYNRYLNTTVALDQNNQWYAASSNMSANGVPGLSFYARQRAAGGLTSASGAVGNNKRALLEIGSDANRVKIPRVHAIQTGTGAANNTNMTRIFMSYADNLHANKPVLFRYGLVGTTGSDNNTAANDTTFRGNFPTRSALSNNTTPRTDGNYTGGATEAAANAVSAQTVADNTTKYRGSIYTAAGGLANGRALVAWFGLDSTDNTEKLFFSYGSGTPANNASHVATRTFNDGTTGTAMNPAAGTWQGNARVIPGTEGKGSHVDMAVDGGNNVHLAFYDANNGGLYYTYIPSDSVVPSTAGSIAGIKTVRVDTFLAVGTKLMLNVRDEGSTGSPKYVPYISYFHGTFTETRNSIRVAWQKEFPVDEITDEYVGPLHGTDENDCFTGAWEAMTVPVNRVPVSDEFICNGLPTYLTGTGSWVAPAGTGALTANPRRSILLGYMTNSWYEGAILKEELY